MIDYREQLISLKEQLKAVEQHLKWCEDNNKPRQQLEVHIKVINDIKEEINNLKQK
jgi:alkyl hydroperoxide reductase subunit AhpC